MAKKKTYGDLGYTRLDDLKVMNLFGLAASRTVFGLPSPAHTIEGLAKRIMETTPTLPLNDEQALEHARSIVDVFKNRRYKPRTFLSISAADLYCMEIYKTGKGKTMYRLSPTCIDSGQNVD